MNPACIVKFRPLGPWRIGPDSGDRDRVDSIYHSDSLYSAVTAAMLSLGLLEEWLDATARNAGGRGGTFQLLFSVPGRYGFVAPPKSIWPPAASSKVRWKGARFVPLPLVELLLNGGALEEDRWSLDGQSECLVPHGAQWAVSRRRASAPPRSTGLGSGVAPHSTACHGIQPWRRALDGSIVRR